VDSNRGNMGPVEQVSLVRERWGWSLEFGIKTCYSQV
jgi:hypothetical protein